MGELLLLVRTARRRYAILRDDVFGIHALPSDAASDPALLLIDLGALFDPLDRSEQTRQHGLFVPLRRKQVVFLVEQIDLVEQPPHLMPLPPLLHARLSQPWALGAMMFDDEPVIQLDLRAVARSMLLAPR